MSFISSVLKVVMEGSATAIIETSAMTEILLLLLPQSHSYWWLVPSHSPSQTWRNKCFLLSSKKIWNIKFQKLSIIYHTRKSMWIMRRYTVFLLALWITTRSSSRASFANVVLPFSSTWLTAGTCSNCCKNLSPKPRDCCCWWWWCWCSPSSSCGNDHIYFVNLPLNPNL